jgi:hypothetical protein
MKPESYFRVALNKWYSDSGSPFLTRVILDDVAEGGLERLNQLLLKWEAAGYLRIIKLPQTATYYEPCVEMFHSVE